ncbi:hypothetical protein [Bacillus paralicheniformis]|uniref:hypothetical protein n=1 Tax=Bacillus paralicheniformis TaxID=1648923 RepID=UPI00398B0BA6
MFRHLFGGTALFKFINAGENLALSQKLTAFLSEMSNAGTFILLVGVLLVMISVSYAISLSFYNKREF